MARLEQMAANETEQQTNDPNLLASVPELHLERPPYDSKYAQVFWNQTQSSAEQFSTIFPGCSTQPDIEVCDSSSYPNMTAQSVWESQQL